MAPFLDPDSVISENQIRAMSRLEPSDDELNKLRSHNLAGFENIFQLELPKRPEIPSRDFPLTLEDFKQLCDVEGRISDPHRLKSLVFRGGIESKLRPILWKYMLNYFKWDKTAAENEEVYRNLQYSNLNILINFLDSKRKRRRLLSYETSMDVNQRGSRTTIFRFPRSKNFNWSET